MSIKQRFSLDGRVAVVTGGAGILGRRCCAGLAEFGATVVVVDLLEDAAVALAAELHQRFGTRAFGVGCDVGAAASVQKMVDTVVETAGRVDILHNNAASKSQDLDRFFAATEDYDLEEWRSVMAVNLDGMFLVAQAVGRRMIAQGRGGSIVQTGSIYGIMGPDLRIYEGSRYLDRQITTPAVYAASKAGVVGLSRYLASTWARHGIRVNTLIPGGIASGQNEEFQRRYSSRVPLGRMGEADEIASALVFLASDASSYMTGQNLIVDGGLEAW
jgi:NAD(P)-dependent dehydrogenase (short-subunit alcohol dehydrogenase family)